MSKPQWFSEVVARGLVAALLGISACTGGDVNPGDFAVDTGQVLDTGAISGLDTGGGQDSGAAAIDAASQSDPDSENDTDSQGDPDSQSDTASPGDAPSGDGNTVHDAGAALDAGVIGDGGAHDAGGAKDAGGAQDAGTDKDAGVVECKTNKDCTGKVGVSGPCKTPICSGGVCWSKNAPENAACDDGSKCTGLEACKAGKCKAHKQLDCDDNNACTTDGCDATTGCKYVKLTATGCTDGDACTTKDLCDKGVCTAGAKLVCDDGNACTTDTCGASKGCVYAPKASGACDDGSNCTKGESCKAGKCVPAGKVDCTDNNPCTKEICDAAKGCKHQKMNAGKCDDGNGCTVLDACVDGTCTGKKMDCSDGNPCTAGLCVLAGECSQKPVTGTCDDGNKCTTNDACAAKKCTGKALVCDDDNACTVDSCHPQKGCEYSANSALCNDGDGCTVNDTCKLKVCKGTKKACDDADKCTTDSCVSVAGKGQCKHTNIAGCEGAKCTKGADCKDNDKCKTSACVAGKCAYKLVDCNDNEQCTADSCESAKGCVNKSLDGPNCHDGDFCTTPDQCVAGSCKGKPNPCSDANPCTTDSCSAGKCQHQSKDSGACDDGNACTPKSACVSGVCKASGPACDDGKPCTKDACVSGSCKHLNDEGAACDDGQACTAGGKCAGGVCKGGSPRLFSVFAGYGVTESWSGLLPLGDGSTIAVGQASGKPLVARFDAGGKLAWKKALGSKTDGLRKVVRGSDGMLSVVGTSQSIKAPNGGKSDGWVVRMSEWGSVTNLSYFGNDGYDWVYDGTALDKDVVFVGKQMGKSGSGEEIWVVRVAPDGKAVWEKTYGSPAHDWGKAIINDGKGGLIAAGHVSVNGKNNTRLLGLKDDGTKKWQHDIAGARPNALTLLKDGRFVAVGSMNAGFHPVIKGFVGLFEATATSAKTIWTTGYGKKWRWYTFDDVAATPDGKIVAVGYLLQQKGSKADGLMVRFDTLGRSHWERRYHITGVTGDGFDNLYAVRALPNGDLVLGGTWPATSNGAATNWGKSLFARTDAFGNWSCKDSGKCLAVSKSGCDDGKVCTANSCDPAKGCQATNFAKLTTCGSAKVCHDGACK